MSEQIKVSVRNENGILGYRIVATATATATATAAAVRPIHVALVMDKSGSMEGERIVSVKKTLTALIDKLELGDKITLVGFSGSASVIINAAVIGNAEARAALKVSVDTLTADGGTNMEAGVVALGALFTGAVAPDSVVVLTDGYVNEGITSVAGIYSLLNSYLPSVPVYALGYGTDHNADFMRALSSRTNGTYTFLDSEIALPAAIGDLLGGLKGEVAKAASISFPADWKCLELNGGDGVIGLGSLILDKPTWVVFDLTAATASTAATANLSYRMVDSGTTYTVSLDSVPTASVTSVELQEQYLRCVVAKALDTASVLIKQYKINDAKIIISATIDKISSSVAAGSTMAIRMKAQLDEMKEELERGGNHHHVLLQASSTATRYTQQRGVSGGANVDDMFSTPTLRRHQTQMVAEYSQISSDPTNDMT